MPDFFKNIQLPKFSRPNIQVRDFSHKKFLGCIRLELGGLIIGIINIILMLILIIYEMIPHERELIEFDGKAFIYERLDIISSAIVAFACTTLLLIGVVKRNHFLILPWLSTSFIILALILLYAILFAIFNRRFNDSEHILFFTLIISLIYYMYNWYICYLIFGIFAAEYYDERNKRIQRTESRVILTEVVISEDD